MFLIEHLFAVRKKQRRSYGQSNRGRETHQIIRLHVRGRPTRRLGKIVNRRLVQQQKERVQRAIFARRLCTVKIRASLAAFVQLLHSLARYLMKFSDWAELNRFRGTRFRAGWFEAVLLSVITELAFMCAAVRLVSIQHSKGARRYAVTTTVADVLLYINISEFVVDDRSGRARFLARRLHAMLAHIAHHQPAIALHFVTELFDESDVPPSRVGKHGRVVIAVAGPMKTVGRKLVPLLARYLARFAADAQRRIGKEAHLLLLLRRLGPFPHLREIFKHESSPCEM